MRQFLARTFLPIIIIIIILLLFIFFLYYIYYYYIIIINQLLLLFTISSETWDNIDAEGTAHQPWSEAFSRQG